MDSDYPVSENVRWWITDMTLADFMAAETGPLWLSLQYWMRCSGKPYVIQHARGWEDLNHPPSDELFFDGHMSSSTATVVVSEPNPSDWTILAPEVGIVPFKELPSFHASWADFLYCKQRKRPDYKRIRELNLAEGGCVSDLTRLLLPVSAGPEVSRVHAIYRQTVEVTTELELEMHQ